MKHEILQKINHFSDENFKKIEDSALSNNYFSPILSELDRYICFDSSIGLDVGCGTGVFMQQLIQRGCKSLHGIDGLNPFNEIPLKRGYKSLKIINDLNYDPLPYENDKFHFVVCKDVLEHLINPKFLLYEISRVLMPGGIFLLHVPNPFTLYGRLKFLLTNNIDTYEYFDNESRFDFPHIRFFENKDILRNVEQFHFKLEKNLCFHFAQIPLVRKSRLFSSLNNFIGNNYPNQFSEAFTYLFKKGN
jgi:SAM-dependent methyltransferase